MASQKVLHRTISLSLGFSKSCKILIFWLISSHPVPESRTSISDNNQTSMTSLPSRQSRHSTLRSAVPIEINHPGDTSSTWELPTRGNNDFPSRIMPPVNWGYNKPDVSWRAYISLLTKHPPSIVFVNYWDATPNVYLWLMWENIQTHMPCSKMMNDFKITIYSLLSIPFVMISCFP